MFTSAVIIWTLFPPLMFALSLRFVSSYQHEKTTDVDQFRGLSECLER